jgi:hypothetical protein
MVKPNRNASMTMTPSFLLTYYALYHPTIAAFAPHFILTSFSKQWIDKILLFRLVLLII